MEKPAANHHKAHRPAQWRAAARPACAGVPLPASRCRAAAIPAPRPGPWPGRRRRRYRDPLLWGKSPNWALRRYVRASLRRVWLRRQAPEKGGAPVPVGGGGPSASAAGQAGRRRLAQRRAARRRLAGGRGVSLSTSHGLRYLIHRNRQLEHLTQVVACLRGGVWRGAAITPRERDVARDLVSAPLGNGSSV